MGLDKGTDDSNRLVKPKGLLTLIEFRAPWCAVCKQQSSIVEQIDQEFSFSLEIQQIDIEENAATAIEMGIQSVPTLILYKYGKEILRFIGLQNIDNIRSILQENLDEKKSK